MMVVAVVVVMVAMVMALVFERAARLGQGLFQGRLGIAQ
jgi:hypothetical protein